MDEQIDPIKELVILRGLPSAGKSYTANQLKGETGVIYSTDEYWYKVNFPDRPEEYSFNRSLLGEAHRWNQLRTQRAIDNGFPLIIIDNTNTTAAEFCCQYVRYAHFQGYKIRIEEPTSEWWLEIRELLKKKRDNSKALKAWAKVLETKSKQTHSVPFWIFEKMMWRWENELTPSSVLEKCLETHP